MDVLLNSKPGLPELAEAGRSFLVECGIAEPLQNAQQLLCHFLNRPASYIYTSAEKASSGLINAYRNALCERASFVPLQYITGEACFFGYMFRVCEGVFIPRPETEILIEAAVAVYRKDFYPAAVRILDICTGCGNIAITLAREIDKCRVSATDISDKSISICHVNASFNRIKTKTRFIKTDLFPSRKTLFHIVTANPPYIADEEMPLLDKEVKREPGAALDGGTRGIGVIERILSKAGEYMVDGGYLLIEIGHRQSRLIKHMYSGLKLVSFCNDLSGIQRIAVFRK